MTDFNNTSCQVQQREEIIQYIRSCPDLQGSYSNLYHATQIMSLFDSLVVEEKLSEVHQSEIDQIRNLLPFIGCLSPENAFKQYSLSKPLDIDSFPTLKTIYILSVFELPTQLHYDPTPPIRCLYDAIVLKDMMECDAVHILENYRKEKYPDRNHTQLLELVIEQCNRITPLTNVGATIYNNYKERFIKQLQHYVALK